MNGWPSGWTSAGNTCEKLYSRGIEVYNTPRNESVARIFTGNCLKCGVGGVYSMFINPDNYVKRGARKRSEIPVGKKSHLSIPLTEISSMLRVPSTAT